MQSEDIHGEQSGEVDDDEDVEEDEEDEEDDDDDDEDEEEERKDMEIGMEMKSFALLS